MTLVHAALLLTSLAGFMALALAMPRHSQHVLRRPLPSARRHLLRLLGWLLLAAALALGMAQWRFGVGLVTWLGWLTIAGVALVFHLSWWAGQSEIPSARARKRQRDNAETGAAVTAVPGHAPMARTMLASLVLLLPLGGFAWQLLHVAEKPLLREDAIHGQIGPWAFSLAEKDRKPPQVVALDVPLKEFVIRFCEGCERDIRMAYLKVREPRSLRAAGNAFEGQGTEKTAEIPVPRSATRDDGLWLTVEANNGEVYHQRFDIQRLSPALAGFIREGT